MLGQRIVTAVVLLALLVPALFAPVSWPFNLLTLLLIGAAAWEWGRLNQVTMAVAVLLGVLLAAACAAALAAGWVGQPPVQAWWLAAAVWVLGGAIALRSGPSMWPQLPRAARLVLGLAALWAAWLAMSHARALGINFILSVFCLVWVADIAAYFGGRRFGKRKLAPSISPGKSWEGVYGAWIAVAAYAAWLVRYASDAGFRFDVTPATIAVWIVFAVALASISVIGDLFESLLKRHAGVKDSGALLPGHGGVLDRTDALLAAMPIAAVAAEYCLRRP